MGGIDNLPKDELKDYEDEVDYVYSILVRIFEWLNGRYYAEWKYEKDCEDDEGYEFGEL